MNVGAPCVFALLVAAGSVSTTKARQPGTSAGRQESKGESIYSEIGKAPEKARTKPNPLEKDPDAARAGRILFAQRCRECHGDDATGGKKGPSLRAPEIQNAEPGAVFWILTNGVVRKGMPVWSKLPEPQRWQLVSYIKSLGTVPRSSPGSPQPPAAKDSSWRPR
ncbi:MAG TPA: cytochrome c [Candidatus Acidoferrum sp.]